jgi:hypothetical protein
MLAGAGRHLKETNCYEEIIDENHHFLYTLAVFLCVQLSQKEQNAMENVQK